MQDPYDKQWYKCAFTMNSKYTRDRSFLDGVDKHPSVNFSINDIFALANVSVISFQVW